MITLWTLPVVILQIFPTFLTSFHQMKLTKTSIPMKFILMRLTCDLIRNFSLLCDFARKNKLAEKRFKIPLEKLDLFATDFMEEDGDANLQEKLKIFFLFNS